jgi:predicted nucleic acid-binding protein
MDAEKYLPQLLEKRGFDAEPGIALLNQISVLTNTVDSEVYVQQEDQAKRRMRNRDPEDWPVVATALIFDCPIWTEDKDFFGSGISTWTTDRIHLFFS